MRRLAIVAHIDQSDRVVPLPLGQERMSNMLRKLHRWSKVEFGHALWEEFRLLCELTGRNPRNFNIWEIPGYSGLHVEHFARQASQEIETLRVNYISPDNMEGPLESIRSFCPDMVLLSTTFVLNWQQLHNVMKLLRKELPETPILLGGNFIFREIFRQQGVKDLPEAYNNSYITYSPYAEQEILHFLSNPDLGVHENIIPIGKDGAVGQWAQKDWGKYIIDAWPIDYRITSLKGPMAPMRLSVGCCFNCRFCSYHTIAGRFCPKER